MNGSMVGDTGSSEKNGSGWKKATRYISSMLSVERMNEKEKKANGNE